MSIFSLNKDVCLKYNSFEIGCPVTLGEGGSQMKTVFAPLPALFGIGTPLGFTGITGTRVNYIVFGRVVLLQIFFQASLVPTGNSLEFILTQLPSTFSSTQVSLGGNWSIATSPSICTVKCTAANATNIVIVDADIISSATEQIGACCLFTLNPY